MKARKPRPDKKLAALTPEQGEQLWAWMRSGASYSTILVLVAKEFQLETSTRALSVWWEERAEHESREQILRAANFADKVGSDYGAKLPEMTKALKGKLTHSAFEAVMTGADPEYIETIMNIVGGMDKGELDRQKIGIDLRKLEQRIREYEEKMAAARAALAGIASKGGLTAETIAEIEAAAKLL